MNIKIKRYVFICIGIVIVIGIIGVVFTYFSNRDSSPTYGYSNYNNFISNVEAAQDLTVFPDCRGNALEPLKVASKKVPVGLDKSFLDYYKAVQVYINNPTDSNKSTMSSDLTGLSTPILQIYRLKNWDVQEIGQNALNIALKYGYPKKVFDAVV